MSGAPCLSVLQCLQPVRISMLELSLVGLLLLPVLLVLDCELVCLQRQFLLRDFVLVFKVLLSLNYVSFRSSGAKS